MNNENELWVTKYAPKSIQDMVLTPELKDMFMSWVKNKSLNNITLYRNSRLWKIYISEIINKRISDVKMFYFNPVQLTDQLTWLKLRLKTFAKFILEKIILKL